VAPTLTGIIERRVLANYRLDAEATAGVLPAPFRPQLVEGFGMGGICLIRLGKVRPSGVCDWVGIRSENAAHRFAVEWEDADGVTRTGVYIPRRDTDSRLNHWAGGRIFPGVHHLARFDVEESDDRVSVSLESTDGDTRVSVAGGVTQALPRGSVFGSLADASAFYEAGALGYSETGEAGVFHGLELACAGWRCEALEVERVRSSFFEDPARFPPGTATFDHALLMRDIEHEWVGRSPLCA